MTAKRVRSIPVWLVFGGLVILLGPSARAQDDAWVFWEDPADAGWDPAVLTQAYDMCENLGSDSLFVVYQGKVLAAWGPTEARYFTHSARKSFMSAVFGIHALRGAIDLQSTMADLEIDDTPRLTPQELTARVVHLLQARSGVYHTAAAETQGMHDYKPPRDSHLPGTYWVYNNWDFNTLVTIFNQETGEDFFEQLQELIAIPLGMEDFTLDDCLYQHEPLRSIHPAYPFMLSARDSARFGQVFLQKGWWHHRPLIPESWVDITTATRSDSGAYIPGTGYGYMWWTFPSGPGINASRPHLGRFEAYAALGAYGQVIMVVPEADFVFAHRVNAYAGHNVSTYRALDVADLILSGKHFDQIQFRHRTVVPHVPPSNAPWTTDLRLANPGAMKAHTRIQLFEARDGQTQQITNESMSLGIHRAKDLGEILSVPGDQRWALVDSDLPLFGDVAFAFQRGRGWEQTTLPVMPLDARMDSLVFPHIPADRDGFWSGFVVLNPNDVPVHVDVVPYGTSGTDLSALLSEDWQTGIDLQPFEKVVGRFETEVFDDWDAEEHVAWVRFDADQGIIGAELFGKHPEVSRGELAGIPAQSTASAGTKTVPFALGDSDWMGLALVNLADAAEDFTVTLRDTEGTILETFVCPAEPRQKILGLLTSDGFMLPYGAQEPWIEIDAAVAARLGTVTVEGAAPFSLFFLCGQGDQRFDGGLPMTFAAHLGLAAPQGGDQRLLLFCDAAAQETVDLRVFDAEGRAFWTDRVTLDGGALAVIDPQLPAWGHGMIHILGQSDRSRLGATLWVRDAGAEGTLSIQQATPIDD